MEKEMQNYNPDEVKVVGRELEQLEELSKKLALMEDIAKYTLLILLSGIEEAEISGYDKAVSVMAGEMNKLAGWTNAAIDDTGNPDEHSDEQLKEIIGSNPFLMRRKN
jgi:methyl-accepting chemotaxis protein